MTARIVREGRQVHSSSEIIAWAVDTTNWGGSPSSPGAEIFLYNPADGTYTDKTTDLFGANTPTVSSNIVTCPALSGSALTIGATYRLEVTFVIGGNTLECVIPIDCEH